MKFALAVSMCDASHYLPLARAAEAHGWTSLAVPDGPFYPKQTRGRYPYTEDGERFWPDDIPFMDPWVVIPAMAAVTERLRFTTFVVKLPIRQPVLMAKQAMSLAVISNDRFGFGIGLSPWPEDFSICETEWKTRGARCAESIEILQEALTGEFFEHKGKHYDFPNMSINPVPGKPMPIIIGGTATPVLKRAARLADGFVSPNTTSDKIKEMVDKIHGYRKEYGTDDKPFEMISVAIDAFDLDGHKRLEEMGIDEACDMPWLYYGGKFTSPIGVKIDAIKRFGDEVISKM